MRRAKIILAVVLVICMMIPTGISFASEPDTTILSSVTVSKYVNKGTDAAPDYQVTSIDITDEATDGKNTAKNASIAYNSSTKVSNLGWDADENENQHWLIELDNSYNLEYIDIIYSHTHLWVDFNVQLSEDNVSWNNLGTIRPDVALENGKPVRVPLRGAKGKYIKLKVEQRYATNGGTAIWGPNKSSGGCSIALFEVVSVKKSEFFDLKSASVSKYVNKGTDAAPDYQIESIDIKDEVTDGKTTAKNASIAYNSSTNASKLGWDADENENQHVIIELDEVCEIGYLNLIYNVTSKWVDFNVQVSEDNYTWKDLGTIRSRVAAANGSPAQLLLNWETGKYIKLKVEKRCATSGSGEWGPNMNAGCTFTLYEVSSVTGLKDSSEPDFSNLISSYKGAFSSKASFTTEGGEDYNGYVGIVFARATEAYRDYERIEYGVGFSYDELTLNEFKTDASVIWVEGKKINSSSQYGIRFYGNKIQSGNRYYTLPYAKYQNASGEVITVYADSVISFMPTDIDWDNVVFYESFENNGSGWLFTASAEDNTSLTIDSSTASDGEKSLYLVDGATTATATAKSPYIDIIAGRGYKVTADIKNVVSNSVKVYTRFYNSTSSTALFSKSIGLSGTEWTPDSDVFIAPEGATRLQIWAAGTKDAKTSAYIDNIVVQELSEEETLKYIPKTLDAPTVIDGIPTEEESFDIYLFLGQSNMVGYDSIVNEDIVVMDGAYLFNGDGNWEIAQPYPHPAAENPEEYLGFNRYSTVAPGTGKMGPSYSFARGMIREVPEGVKIGMVSNARGGTTIEQWAKGFEGTADLEDYDLYEQAVLRANAALAKGGRLKAIFWLQGEACAAKAGYMDKLKVIADGLREELGVTADETPFIVSEVPHVKPQSVAGLQTAPQYIENCYLVSSAGLKVFDSIHFYFDAQRVLGLRFAEKALLVVYNKTVSADDMYNAIYK